MQELVPYLRPHPHHTFHLFQCCNIKNWLILSSMIFKLLKSKRFSISKPNNKFVVLDNLSVTPVVKIESDQLID